MRAGVVAVIWAWVRWVPLVRNVDGRVSPQEEEPAAFNKLLHNLRDEFAGGAFWAALNADDDLRRGLICVDETDESPVSAADAMAFVQSGSPQPAAPPAPTSPLAEDYEYGGSD